MLGDTCISQGLLQLPNAGPPCPTTPPWVVAAATPLGSLRPNTHPALALLAHCSADQHEVDMPPCPALRPMGSALAALGPVMHIDINSFPVGHWCTHMLLWANPFMCLELPLSCRPPYYLAAMQRHSPRQPPQLSHQPPFPDPNIASQALAELPQLGTLAQLQSLLHRLQDPSSPARALLANCNTIVTF